MSKTKATDVLPTLAEIAAVEYDRAQSTPWHERYTVASATNDGVRHVVTYDVSERLWSCSGEWCGRAQWCKHRQKAAVLKEALWWESLLDGSTPAELRALIPTKQQQVRLDVDALSAHGAILAIHSLLLAGGETEVAA